MNRTIDDNIKAFAQLSDFMKAVAEQNKDFLPANLEIEYNELNNLINNDLQLKNPWFIPEFVRYQLNALANVTTEEKLCNWLKPYYSNLEKHTPKRIGVVMAGNIALVGFHDFLTVLITNNYLVAKTSSKDEVLPKFIASVLIKIDNYFADRIIWQDKLQDFEAVIATGSTNTSRYFEHYFGKVPHIIRKSRNSIAVLDGNETDEELAGLTDDIFLHFGLGCRNVSKIYIPEDFDIQRIFEPAMRYSHLINHHKYANNYEYNRAVYLLSQDKFFDNNFFLLKEDSKLASPVAVLYFQRYKDLDYIRAVYESLKEKIQIVVSHMDLGFDVVQFGKSQIPELHDYEDNVNTLDFVTNL